MAKKVFTLLMAVMLVVCYMPGMAFAGTDENATNTAKTKFVDMPSDWSTTALENAAANGLIKGYEDTDGLHIKPNGTLKRAEMATVVNRAFGSKEKASLGGVNDIASGAWYEAEMAKAVHMGTMKKDSQMRPNANITRQEACTILARAFKMKSSSKNALDKFADKGSVASWAKESLSALVEKGYMTGSAGNLNPKANMTRAQFAKIMDNMVKEYITTAGTVEKVAEKGNVMVNVPGVTLKNVTVYGDLIIGDGVGTGEFTLDSVKVTGNTIVRGGGVNSVIIKGNSNIGNVVIAKVDGNVRVAVEGNAKVSVVVVEDGKNDVKVEGKITTLKVEAETPVVIQKAEIANVEVVAKNADVTVAKDAKVTTLKVEATKTDLKINGTVKNVKVEKQATGAKIEISKDAKVTKLEANANVTTSGEGKAATTTGTGDIKNSKGEVIKKGDNASTGGGGGSSSGGGGGHTPTPDYKYQVKVGEHVAQITDLVKNENAKFEMGSYEKFANVCIVLANDKATEAQKKKIQDILTGADSSLTGIDFDSSKHDKGIMDAYDALNKEKTLDNFQALALATAVVLDKQTSTKEKIVDEYIAVANKIKNEDIEATYNGKKGTLTEVVATVKGENYVLFEAKKGADKATITKFVDAVYGNKLVDVIDKSAEITVKGTDGAADVSYTAEIIRF